MNILIIEDNASKREKIHEFIKANFEAQVSEAASYNSGINIALQSKFDLIVLDMSMPTFDRTDVTHGGRFRTVAGKEIAAKLAKLKRLVPFVVLTGYKDFNVLSGNLSISEIDELLRVIGKEYLGYIVFDAPDSVWKDELSKVIKGVLS